MIDSQDYCLKSPLRGPLLIANRSCKITVCRFVNLFGVVVVRMGQCLSPPLWLDRWRESTSFTFTKLTFSVMFRNLSDTPIKFSHSQYHNAHRLGQLIREVPSREHQSFPYLAHRLSIWNCKKEEDRLNALYGIFFHYDGVSPCFHPSYELKLPDLCKRFATNQITITRRLDILYFAGCADKERLDFRIVDWLCQILCQWYALTCAIVGTTDIAEKFASTTTMD